VRRPRPELITTENIRHFFFLLLLLLLLLLLVPGMTLLADY
jgi:hypothetical protein